jgi:hypothetical protein
MQWQWARVYVARRREGEGGVGGLLLLRFYARIRHGAVVCFSFARPSCIFNKPFANMPPTHSLTHTHRCGGSGGIFGRCLLGDSRQRVGASHDPAAAVRGQPRGHACAAGGRLRRGVARPRHHHDHGCGPFKLFSVAETSWFSSSLSLSLSPCCSPQTTHYPMHLFPTPRRLLWCTS